jgi:hypothetical protein
MLEEEIMKKAGEEKRRLAKGAMDSDNKPCITVIADGGWSTRSHGHRYSALSGVACIIGPKTGKLLFFGVRNKYCSICALDEKSGITRPHKCYKNCDQPSPAMESDIIEEGFWTSEETHG